MASAIGFIFHCVNIERLCFLYFFLAPVFLPRENVPTERIVFGLGYVLSGTILALAFAERLSSFSDIIRIRKYSFSILALVAICFLTIAINTPSKLFFSPADYYFKYFKLIFPVACFFVMVNIWSLRELPKLYTLLMAMAWVSLFGLLPELVTFIINPSETPRFGSFFLEPNKYALFLNVVYGMTLPNYIDAQLKGKKSSYLLAVNFGIVVLLFLTQSRSGILTWSILTGISFWPRPARNLFKKALPVLLPAALLLLLAIVLRYLNATSSAKASDLGRLWTYMVGFNIIAHRPLLGIGFGNIISYYDQYGGIYRILLGRAMAIHNTVLEIFAEEGFFGALFYLILIFTPITVLTRRLAARAEYYSAVEIAGLAIPVAFFCFGLFYPNYLADDYFWVYMAFTFIVLRSKVPEGYDFKMSKPVWA